MILISVCPFAPKRVFALIAAVVALLAVTCLASTHQFTPVGTTPYDAQMARIRPFLAINQNEVSPEPCIQAVNSWMLALHCVPYGFSSDWKTPAELQYATTADCKSKAVALYCHMIAGGAKDLCVVIGKRTIQSAVTHAWLQWNAATGIYILDPAINAIALPVAALQTGSYVPYYAYAGDRRYRADLDLSTRL